MEQTKDDIRLGRYISLVLRHDPSAAGVQLDEHGWVKVEDLLAGMAAHGHRVTIQTLLRAE